MSYPQHVVVVIIIVVVVVVVAYLALLHTLGYR